MTELIEHDAPPGGVPYLLRTPREQPAGIMLMLHGFTGDERVMWVLDSVIPADFLTASLRGTFPTPIGGYQWIRSVRGMVADFDEYREAVQAIESVYHGIRGDFRDSLPLFVMGFSQGAATAFALGSMGGIPVKGVVALAGYLPSGGLIAGDWDVFWGHGNQDEMVPLERARTDVKRLQGAGIDVQYCEADVGHKLGVECTRGLRKWLEMRSA